MEKLESMSAAVRQVIDDYPVGHQFFGNELKDDVVRVYPDAINMFPDTILRMARRHRREYFHTIDHNRSLYERLNVKSITQQINELRELAEKKKTEEKKQPLKLDTVTQLSLFGVHFFLAVFFVFFIGVVLEVFERDPIPLSLIAAKSSFLYIPVGPMYLNGCIPSRCNRLFIASVDTVIPIACAISKIVIPSSMNISINQYRKINQVNYVKKCRIRNILILCHFDTVNLTKCVKMTLYSDSGTIYRRKRIFKNFHKNLDRYSMPLLLC
jgi:hypothetical protein